jgi:hypothetical protein
MPFFIIPAFWAFCCLIGILTLLFRRTRFLAFHIVIGSTGASFLSLVLLIVIMLAFAGSRVSEGSVYGWIAIVVATLVFFGGTIAGGVYGMHLATRLNNRLGWTKSPTDNPQPRF